VVDVVVDVAEGILEGGRGPARGPYFAITGIRMWACLICLHPTPHLAKRGATFVLGEQRAASNDAFPSFLGLVLEVGGACASVANNF
jgi:hypothetical protein